MKFTHGMDEHVPAASGGGVRFLTFLKDPVTILRFQEDYDDLRLVYMHFDRNLRTSFPCPGDPDQCPGCINKFDRSAKIVGVATNVSNGYTNVYVLPISLKDSFARVQDRDGTLKARDLAIYKDGTGTSTSYSLDREDKVERDPVDPQFFPDVDETLKEAWRYGTDTEYRDSRQKENAEKAPKATVERKDTKERKPSVMDAVRSSVKESDGPPPFDDPEGAEEATPRGEMTEAEVRNMKYVALIQLAAEVGVDDKIDDDMSKQDVADLIINKMGV